MYKYKLFFSIFIISITTSNYIRSSHESPKTREAVPSVLHTMTHSALEQCLAIDNYDRRSKVIDEILSGTRNLDATILAYAIEYASADTVQRLLNVVDRETCQAILEQRPFIVRLIHSSLSSLERAVALTRPDIVRILLSHGARVHVDVSAHYNPTTTLYYLFIHMNSMPTDLDKALSILDLLVAHGLDFLRLGTITNSIRNSAIEDARNKDPRRADIRALRALLSRIKQLYEWQNTQIRQVSGLPAFNAPVWYVIDPPALPLDRIPFGLPARLDEQTMPEPVMRSLTEARSRVHVPIVTSLHDSQNPSLTCPRRAIDRLKRILNFFVAVIYEIS